MSADAAGAAAAKDKVGAVDAISIGQSYNPSSRGCISGDSVYRMAGLPAPAQIDAIMEALLCGKYIEAYDTVREVLDRNDYSLQSVIPSIYKRVLLLDMPFSVRSRIVAPL